MKVLFLDIDGVLNSCRTAVAFGGYPMKLEHLGAFDGVAVRLIQRMCDIGGVKVVLSSAWRLDYTAEEVAKALDLPVIDRTPVFPLGPRGKEIQHWLDNNHWTSYAIVDDDADMLPEQRAFFVKTEHEEGLSFKNYQRLCQILNVPEVQFRTRHRLWKQPQVDWNA